MSDHVVLMVLDHLGARSELKQALGLKGYRVIDTDNGRDAARNARLIHPDLLVVDMDVPLLYGLVAARQIVKNLEMGPMPLVIITYEDEVKSPTLMEADVARKDNVTRLSEYQELQSLLDYLLPVLVPKEDAAAGIESLLTRAPAIRLPLLAASASGPHLHRDAVHGEPDLVAGQSVHLALGYESP